MNVVKRICIFIGALILLNVAAIMLGSVIAGALAGSQFTDPKQAAIAGSQAGLLFSLKYRALIGGVDIVLAAALAFGARVLTFVFAIPFAVICFLGLQRVSKMQEAQTKATLSKLSAALEDAAPRPTTLPSQLATPLSQPKQQLSLIGKRMALAKPFAIKVAYGQMVLPAGTVVVVISQTDDSAMVKTTDGSTFSLPLNQLR